jgi:hypothetical protein
MKFMRFATWSSILGLNTNKNRYDVEIIVLKITLQLFMGENEINIGKTIFFL